MRQYCDLHNGSSVAHYFTLVDKVANKCEELVESGIWVSNLRIEDIYCTPQVDENGKAAEPDVLLFCEDWDYMDNGTTKLEDTQKYPFIPTAMLKESKKKMKGRFKPELAKNLMNGELATQSMLPLVVVSNKADISEFRMFN